jgi:hypothetical protein
MLYADVRKMGRPQGFVYYKAEVPVIDYSVMVSAVGQTPATAETRLVNAIREFGIVDDIEVYDTISMERMVYDVNGDVDV